MIKKLARRVDIYLAWQTISDGRKQIRRYSPSAKPSELKLFEPVSKAAIDWLASHGDPEYPDCLSHIPIHPYLVAYIGPETRHTV